MRDNLPYESALAHHPERVDLAVAIGAGLAWLATVIGGLAWLSVIVRIGLAWWGGLFS